MPFGLLTGLSAALAWGTLDVITALGSRVVGSLRVTAGMQLVTAVIFAAILVVISGTSLPTDARLDRAGGPARHDRRREPTLATSPGLQFGPIAVVSGMVAAFGGLTVVLSVLFRGESLTLLQAVGATIATVGVLLTGLAFDGGLRSVRFAGPGVVFAVDRARAVLADGDHDRHRPRDDDLAPGLLDRPGGERRDRDRRDRHPHGRRQPARSAVRSTALAGRRPGSSGRITLAGVLDVLGLIAFATGLESAPTWMVSLAASFGPAVTIIVAVALLGERLRPVQWFGLAGILIGMVAIAIP